MEEKDQDTVAGAEPTAGEGTKSGVQEGGSSMGGHCAGLLTLRNCNGHLVVGRRHQQERKDTNQGAGAVVPLEVEDWTSLRLEERGTASAEGKGGWGRRQRWRWMGPTQQGQESGRRHNVPGMFWSKTNVAWPLLAVWDVPRLKTGEHTIGSPNPNTSDGHVGSSCCPPSVAASLPIP